jgi:molybdopterin synthase sulfur carrier subunit
MGIFGQDMADSADFGLRREFWYNSGACGAFSGQMPLAVHHTVRAENMIVRFFGTLRQFAGANEVEVSVEPGDKVRDVLHKLTAEDPLLKDKLLDADGVLQSSLHVLVNGRSISYLDGLNTSIHEGDRFALFPAVGGG